MKSWIETASRRAFLQRLALLPASLFAPPALKPTGRQTSVGRFSVAGFRYYRGPELIGRVRPGEAVRLVPEPQNPHDALAVRVEYRGEKVGYIPRRENQAVHRLLRDGADLNGRVIEARPEAAPWGMLVVEAVLKW